MPRSTSESADESSPGDRPPRRRRRVIRRVALAVGALVLLAGGWLAAVRLTAGMRAIRVIEDAAIPQSAERGAPDTLRIGTWNIAHCRGLSEDNFNGESAAIKRRRAVAIGEMLAELDLDIVVLNEVDFDSTWSGDVNQAQVIARAAGFRWRMEQRNVDFAVPFVSICFGNVVLSRAPISDAAIIEFPSHSWWESAIFGRKRGAICTIEVADSTVQVAPVHLDHRWGADAIRDASLCAILDARDAELPLIAAGDFNTSPPGFPRVRASRQDANAMSMFLEEGRLATVPRAEPQPYDFTFRADALDRVLDWIVVPGAWTIVSKRTIRSELSDHLPVVMEVEIEEATERRIDETVEG